MRPVLMVAMAMLASLGATSSRRMWQHAMCFPWRGWHFTIIEAGSNADTVITATENCSWTESWCASAEMVGAVACHLTTKLDDMLQAEKTPSTHSRPGYKRSQRKRLSQ